MNCLRCGKQMYRVVNADQSATARCSTCCNFRDCAQCSDPACGETKCIPCYNRNGRPTSMLGDLAAQDDAEV